MSSDVVQSTDIDGGAAPEGTLAEHERQFRELLEFCPAALQVVDDDGRLLFHNLRVRENSRIQPRRTQSI